MAQNLLLSVLPERERRRIAPHCETVQLTARKTLYEPDSEISHVWFPDSGVCSTLVHVDGGEAVEVGLVGREGMVGIPVVLGCSSNAFHVIVQIAGTATRIGRSPDNDIVLSDVKVSRHHAVITDNGATLVITDLGSANGVLVAGQRIDPSAELSEGDRIRIGDQQFTLEISHRPSR